MIVWLNGELIDRDTARIDPADRGLLLADGVFETLRRDAAGGLLRIHRHLARLRAGAAVFGIQVPLDDDEIVSALHQTAAANRLDDAMLRLTLTRGPGPRGVLPPADPTPTVLIAAAPVPPPPGPARLVTATTTRRNEHSPLSRIKHLGYGDSLLALREAVAAGAHDAVLLNTAGRVAETTVATLFLRLDGAWCTPPVSEGALPGTLRGEILETGAAVEAVLTVADLARAEAAFLASAGGRRPVSHIDGRPLPEPAP